MSFLFFVNMSLENTNIYIYMYKYVIVYFSNLNICLIMVLQRNRGTPDSGGSRIFQSGLSMRRDIISVSRGNSSVAF